MSAIRLNKGRMRDRIRIAITANAADAAETAAIGVHGNICHIHLLPNIRKSPANGCRC